MANFNEVAEWIDVTLPVNTDFNVAEKTTLTFIENHGFMVGDFLTEQISGATGIVYEVLSNLEVNVARQDSVEFPESGVVKNTIEESVPGSTYVSRTISHGINNLVIQELVNRTYYNKNRFDNLELYHNTLDGIQGGTTGEYYHLEENELDDLQRIISGNYSGLDAFSTVRFKKYNQTGESDTPLYANEYKDEFTLVAGPNVAISADNTNNEITISADSKAVNKFTQFVVFGKDEQIVAESSDDRIVFMEGDNITMELDGDAKTVIISSTGGGGETIAPLCFKTIKSVNRDGTTTEMTADSSTDTFTLRAGTGIELIGNSSSDEITINSAGSGGVISPDCFKTIRVDLGGSSADIIADSSSDILKLNAGTGISFQTSSSDDSITINSTATGGDGGPLPAIITNNSMVIPKNRKIVANINGSYDINLTLPGDVVNGDWVNIYHGGTDVLRGKVFVSGNGANFADGSSIGEIDVAFTDVSLIYNQNAWHYMG